MSSVAVEGEQNKITYEKLSVWGSGWKKASHSCIWLCFSAQLKFAQFIVACLGTIAAVFLVVFLFFFVCALNAEFFFIYLFICCWHETWLHSQCFIFSFLSHKCTLLSVLVFSIIVYWNTSNDYRKIEWQIIVLWLIILCRNDEMQSRSDYLRSWETAWTQYKRWT